MAFDLSNIGKMIGIGGGAGQAAGGLASLFGHQRNPSASANQYFNQIPGQTQQYYSPYMEAGKGAMSTLQNQYGDLLSGNTQNKLGENYKESPGYKFALDQALQGGTNAAAAGGMLGTPQHEQQNMGIANGLASQDYNNYLHNQMGLYGQGLQGTQGLNQMGYNANTGYADLLANLLGQQGQYAYAGQAGKNAGRTQGMQDVFGGISSLLPFLFG